MRPQLSVDARPNMGPNKRKMAIRRMLALVALLETITLIVLIALRVLDVGSSPAQATTAAAGHAGRRGASSTPATTPQLPPFPSIKAMENAAAFMQSRAGRTAFAVVDSRGREYGLNDHDTFLSASTVKSMLLVSYLRNLAAHHETIGPESQALLYPMIHVSDNYAAEAVWHLVGDAGLQGVARHAKMTDFTFGPDWANEEISPADMARFFYRMDSLIPRQFRSYARSLLSGIDPTQSWGIAQAAGSQWKVFFKGGWRGTPDGQLVSQIARLEQPGRKIAIAVMTVTDPSMDYGEDTIEGVAARLLGTSSGA